MTAIGLILGNGALFFGHQILGFYSSDPEVIAYGIQRMQIICFVYFICGIMDVLVGSIRGLGYALMPMFVSLMGACVFRVIWVYTIDGICHRKNSFENMILTSRIMLEFWRRLMEKKIVRLERYMMKRSECLLRIWK